MAHMKEFPHVPIMQKEMTRAMRRATETDEGFLHRLITSFVDSYTVCPRAADIIAAAERARALKSQPIGDPACAQCYGSGYRQITRKVRIPGIEPYTAEAAEICGCRGGK